MEKVSKRKKYQRWNKESALEEGGRYKSRTDFLNQSPGAFFFLKKHKLLDDIFLKPSKFWTKERVIDEGKKYNSKSQFQLNNSCAYYWAKKLNILDELSISYTAGRKGKPYGYWTEEQLAKEALKYNSRSEFQKKNPGAYSIATKKKIKDKICSHMTFLGSRWERMIYAYEFSKSKKVYVGLTYNLEQRDRQHLICEKHRINSQVFKFKEQTKEIPVLVKISDYLILEDAIKLEHDTVEEYKRKGWTILNIAKTGNVGSHDLHSKEDCRLEALKYKKRFHFQKNSSGFYKTASRNGWLDELCQHMIPRLWTKERCAEIANKCKTRREFFKYRAAYGSAWRNKWLDELCKHMPKLNRWSKNKVNNL